MKQIKYYFFSGCFVCALLITGQISAQTQTSTIDTSTTSKPPMVIYITGSGIASQDSYKNNTTLVIDKTQIEAAAPKSVSQLLSQLPGLHVENAGARGGISSVYLRGADPNFTLVLINGIKVNDPTNTRGGAYDFSLLDVNSIERIEIVKGPVSFLYGSNALAGVINIITSPVVTEQATTIQAGTGTDNNKELALNQTWVEGNSSYYLSAGFVDDGEPIEGSQWQGTNLNWGIQSRESKNTLISLNGYYQNSRSEFFPDASGGAQYAVFRDLEQVDNEQQQMSLDIQHQFANKGRIKFSTGLSGSNEDIDSPGISPGFDIPPRQYKNSYNRKDLFLSYTLPAGDILTTSIGISGEFEDGTSSGVLDFGVLVPVEFELQRNVYAVFMENRLNWAATEAILGLRLDKPEGQSREISPRAGISQQFNHTVLQFDWGRSFKLPSFFALGDPNVGNPDFAPETSESFQFSVNHEIAGDLQFSGAVFYNTFEDLIDFDFSPPQPKLVQRSEVTSKGIELSLRKKLSSALQLDMSYTRLKHDIKDSGDELQRRPVTMAKLALQWRNSNIHTIRIQAAYTGEVNDTAIPTGPRTLDDYTLLDFVYNWRYAKGQYLKLAVNNLLDEHYEQAIGFESTGINARLGLKITLNQ